MGYSIYLNDPVTGEIARVPGHFMIGSTYKAEYHPETGNFTPAVNVEAELNITYMPSFSPVIDGKYIFFTAMDDTGCYLCKIDMSNPEVFPCEVSDNYVMTTSFLIDETYIYTANNIKLIMVLNLNIQKMVLLGVKFMVSRQFRI